MSISLFCARSNVLVYLLLNMYHKKPANYVGIDSACKRKHEQNRGIDTETGQWR